ncbi:MAG: GNAT family N-acetyltransferase [Nocardioidaceae bacterium]
MTQPIVPADFTVPAPLVTAEFRFEPLSAAHNQADHAAWTGSLAHIQATPGFAGRTWPDTIETLEDNERSLLRHQEDFAARVGFAYAVLTRTTGEYVGCVYFYPPRDDAYDVDVRSWVRANLANLDKPLHDAVRSWLSTAWPWHSPDYARR